MRSFSCTLGTPIFLTFKKDVMEKKISSYQIPVSQKLVFAHLRIVAKPIKFDLNLLVEKSRFANFCNRNSLI